MKCKKIFALLLSLCMITSSFVAMPVLAADNMVIEVGVVKAEAGATIEVPVSLSENIGGLCGLTINFTYDPTILNYVLAEKGEALPSLDFSKPGSAYVEGDLTFNWDGMDADYTNGEIMIFTFKVLDSVADGNYPINAEVEKACDFDLNDVYFDTVAGEVEVHTHVYDAGVVTKEATCEDTGVKTYTCACGDEYTEEIPANGHAYDAGVVTTDPTCTETGVKTYTCGNCGDTYTEVVPANGHNMTFVAEIPAECEADGTKAHYICSVCGKTYEDEAGSVELTDLVIPATGHTYGEWQKNDADSHKKVCTCGDVVTEAHAWDAGVITTKPTVDAEGVKTYTCTVCDETKTESIDKIDPDTLTTLTVKNVTASSGEEVLVPVAISKNAGLTGMIINVDYDETALTLVGATQGEALGNLDLTIPGDLSIEPAVFLWDGLDADNSNGNILVLKFKVADAAIEDEYAVSVTVTMACDQNLDDVEIIVDNGSVKVANYKMGDVDDDGIVGVKDVVFMRRFIAGGYGVVINEKAADVDSNGTIEVQDLVLMRRYITGGYGVEF